MAALPDKNIAVTPPVPDRQPTRRRQLVDRVSEAPVLFPAIAVLVLVIVWGATLHIISAEKRNAERLAVSSTLELADTYEAQMLRNLREIDQSLKVVKYAYEVSQDAGALAELKVRQLLPPDLVFSLAIIDRVGRIHASTRPVVSDYSAIQAHLDATRRTDELWVSPPRANAEGEWKMEFSRRLVNVRGEFAGAVVLAVDAAYFVSVYEATKLGEKGVLGLTGRDDDVFRVRRTGERITAGGESASGLRGLDDGGVVRLDSTWDGVTRFVRVRPLFGFPLAMVVGLAEEEQLADARAKSDAYIGRAAMGSVVVLALIGLLGRASWRLAQTTKRENEARLEHAERVQYLAYHDGLTGLPNRTFFGRILDQSISQARRYRRSLAVLFLDLDRFKHINDTLGHQAGDELLQELAKRLRSCLRESDTVARLGGDEFVVLLPELDEDTYVSHVAQKLLEVVTAPVALPGYSLVVTASIGIAVHPRDGDDEQTLMKRADAAMYHAKSEGRNNFQFFATALQANSLRRLTLEANLRHALERGDLHLVYQPKIDLETGRMTGVEALLRWHDREHGIVAPAEFIPIAEDTGLIIPIGRWVLRTACAQTAAWMRRGLPPLSVAVNLSARQFADAGLVDDVAAALAESGLDGSQLELEITESLLMDDIDRAVRKLTVLSGMGVRLAIDDFGTGYSSLSNLKRFPLTTLKIDRSFICDLPFDTDNRVITEAIVAMGKALRMDIVAEGVETQAQAQYLRERGCDIYQGFFHSRPLTPAQLETLLRAADVEARPGMVAINGGKA